MTKPPAFMACSVWPHDLPNMELSRQGTRVALAELGKLAVVAELACMRTVGEKGEGGGRR